jgi:Uma2 family endonuclease
MMTMATTVKQRYPLEYLLLENISWETYDRLAREAGKRHIRFTYDQGDLEIMTLSFAHEHWGDVLAQLIVVLALELSLPYCSAGSTTLRRKLTKQGLEPDHCFWFQNERRMRGRQQWKARRDPPPDLALEIEVSRSALNRMRIYAGLRIPEVWRVNRRMFKVYHLTKRGSYEVRDESTCFPFLCTAELLPFLKRHEGEDQMTLLQCFREWINAEVRPRYEAWKHRSKKNGK